MGGLVYKQVHPKLPFYSSCDGAWTVFPLLPEDGQYLGQAQEGLCFSAHCNDPCLSPVALSLPLAKAGLPPSPRFSRQAVWVLGSVFDKKISFHKSRPAVPHGVLSDKVISKSCTPTPHLHIQQLT